MNPLPLHHRDDVGGAGKILHPHIGGHRIVVRIPRNDPTYLSTKVVEDDSPAW